MELEYKYAENYADVLGMFWGFVGRREAAIELWGKGQFFNRTFFVYLYPDLKPDSKTIAIFRVKKK